jgi:hypothetical protein
MKDPSARPEESVTTEGIAEMMGAMREEAGSTNPSESKQEGSGSEKKKLQCSSDGAVGTLKRSTAYVREPSWVPDGEPASV